MKIMETEVKLYLSKIVVFELDTDFAGVEML